MSIVGIFIKYYLTSSISGKIAELLNLPGGMPLYADVAIAFVLALLFGALFLLCVFLLRRVNKSGN